MYIYTPYESMVTLRCCLQGVGRRYSMVVCRKADVDPNKRAGEMTDEEVSLECVSICPCFRKRIFHVQRPVITSQCSMNKYSAILSVEIFSMPLHGKNVLEFHFQLF